MNSELGFAQGNITTIQIRKEYNIKYNFFHAKCGMQFFSWTKCGAVLNAVIADQNSTFNT